MQVNGFHAPTRVAIALRLGLPCVGLPCLGNSSRYRDGTLLIRSPLCECSAHSVCHTPCCVLAWMDKGEVSSNGRAERDSEANGKDCFGVRHARSLLFWFSLFGKCMEWYYHTTLWLRIGCTALCTLHIHVLDTIRSTATIPARVGDARCTHMNTPPIHVSYPPLRLPICLPACLPACLIA